MSEYRFEIVKDQDVDCLHVLVGDEEIVDASIPLCDIQTAMYHAGVKWDLPSVGRIKISAGGIEQYKNGLRVCFPQFDFCQSMITDADTGQCLSFVNGIEISSTIPHGTIVKLLVADFELDCHIQQQLKRTGDWRIEDARASIKDLQHQLEDIDKWSEMLRFKIQQLEAKQTGLLTLADIDQWMDMMSEEKSET